MHVCSRGLFPDAPRKSAALKINDNGRQRSPGALPLCILDRLFGDLQVLDQPVLPGR